MTIIFPVFFRFASSFQYSDAYVDERDVELLVNGKPGLLLQLMNYVPKR